MPTVYIETTIPSFYFETRRAPILVAWRDITRHWWDVERFAFDLATSEYVIAELEMAPTSKSHRAISMLAGIPRLSDSQQAIDVAEYYIEHRLMPRGAGGDAMHIALASVHGCEYLLTWNCRHLANENKITHLRVLNGRLGLPVPAVVTPVTLSRKEPS